MTLKEYVKIAVGLREHPKILEAGDDAGWFYVCSIMWSKEHDTDGFIPEYAISRITGKRRPRELVTRLVRVGLFEETASGWLIHDYLEVQESSERRKAAGKKAAEARWEAKRSMRIASESQCGSHPDRNANAMRDRNAEEEEEKEEEKPPLPPRGNRTRDRLEFEDTALKWIASAGVAGDRDNLIRAYRQSGAWKHPDPAGQLRRFCRQHFPHLTVEEEPMAEVRPLPGRDAA